MKKKNKTILKQKRGKNKLRKTMKKNKLKQNLPIKRKDVSEKLLKEFNFKKLKVILL